MKQPTFRIKLCGDLILRPTKQEDETIDYTIEFVSANEKIKEPEKVSDWKKEYNSEKSVFAININDVMNILNSNKKETKVPFSEDLPKKKRNKEVVDFMEIAKIILQIFTIEQDKKYSMAELFKFLWDDVYFVDHDLNFDQMQVLEAINQALDFLTNKNFLRKYENKYFLPPQKLNPSNKMA